MAQITIKMKSGSQMTVEAEGRCFKDRDGAGQTFEVVEDLACFWPGKKRREIPYGLYDVRDAEDKFWEAAEAASKDY